MHSERLQKRACAISYAPHVVYHRELSKRLFRNHRHIEADLLLLQGYEATSRLQRELSVGVKDVNTYEDSSESDEYGGSWWVSRLLSEGENRDDSVDDPSS